MKTKILYGAAGAIIAAVILSLSSGPQSYDDCILEHMKGVQSNRAAAAIRDSCRSNAPGISLEEWASRQKD